MATEGMLGKFSGYSIMARWTHSQIIDIVFRQPHSYLERQVRVGEMKTLARLLVAAALLFVARGAALSASEPIGKVLSAVKTVRANGTVGTRVLAKSEDIFFLDRISTNSTGVGEFEFSDGTKLAVGPSASLVVDKFIFRNKSTFQKLSLSAARGTFRWISGHSPSSAYQIRTPLGTMGIRGTAFDVTIRNGRVYVALITGSAKFCAGSTCRTLNRSCDYIVADGRKISEPERVATASSKQVSAAQIFPYLANPKKLSSRFRVGGGNCLSKIARIYKGGAPRPNDKVKAETAAEEEPEPDPEPDPHPNPPHEHCDGTCGNGQGHGGGHGTDDEGGGNDP